MSALWAERVLVDGVIETGVRFETDGTGRITSRETDVPALPGDDLAGFVIPGFANAHSHLFHRVLRGRTHDDGGDFWAWREQMYAAAAELDPDSYRELATAVFGEMIANGYTAVGEFHYVHHRPTGAAYDDHNMELAIADAAAAVGIRLTLLDTCYLAGGIGQPLSAEQRRFGDGDAAGWLARWHALRARLDERGNPLVTLGAAIHSVRVVPAEAIAEIIAGLPSDVPLHIHLSEQPRENAESIEAYGETPTGLIAGLGVLAERLSVVHATHLTDSDIRLLGDAGVSVVMCPTTEADLGDGIGPARALADAGASITLGSDQNAVIDPFLEVRGLEAGERLASGERGRFSPAELLVAGTSAGYRSLGLGEARLEVGHPLDVVEIDLFSARTIGARPEQIGLVASGSDVSGVWVGGTRVVTRESGGLVAISGIGSLPELYRRVLKHKAETPERADTAAPDQGSSA